MRPFKRVKMLNADEYRVLKRAVVSRKIAQTLGCNERTALKWTGRFNRHGFSALEGVLRSGR